MLFLFICMETSKYYSVIKKTEEFKKGQFGYVVLNLFYK